MYLFYETNLEKQQLRHCILFCFQVNKNIAQAMELINLIWLAKFRVENFSLDNIQVQSKHLRMKNFRFH